MNESGFNVSAEDFEFGAEYRQQIDVSSEGKYLFFRTRRYGKLHFEKRLADLSDPVAAEALRKEFEIGYGLQHPGIVSYLAYENNSIFEEYIDGLTLRQMRQRFDIRLLQPDFLHEICRQVLEALAYVHRNGVVHLDIKPENVMVCNVGNAIKLIDLGAARNGTFDRTEGYTEAYMAPEQGAGGRTGVQTDIYLVGRLMDELASAAGYRASWESFINKATAENPKDRFRNTAQALAAIPAKVQQLPPTAPPRQTAQPSTTSSIDNTESPKPQGKRFQYILLLCMTLAALLISWAEYFPNSFHSFFHIDEEQKSPIGNVTGASSSTLEFEQAKNLIQGIGCAPDEAEGMRLMHVAAEKGDQFAQCYLGLMYRDGTATLKRDPVKSLEWTSRSAAQGNEIAMEEMGYKYYEGFGVDQDYGEAMKWLKRAAAKGKSSAYSSIGIMYRDGEGVAQDYAKAEKYFLQGMKAGNSYSTFLLGRLYAHYMNPGDPAKALEYYRKASDMGSHRATETLMQAYTYGDPELAVSPDSILATKYHVRLESSDAQ